MNKTCPILKKKWMWTLKQPQPAYKKRKVTPLCIKLLWWKYISVGHDKSKRIDLIVLARQKDSSNFFVWSWVYVVSLNDVNFNLSYHDCVNSTEKLVWHGVVGLQKNIMRKIFIYCSIIIPCLLNIKSGYMFILLYVIILVSKWRRGYDKLTGVAYISSFINKGCTFLH